VPTPPLKLLLVINNLFPAGGAETQLPHLARGLADLGHEVTICCVGICAIDTRSLTNRGVEVIVLGATARGGRLKEIPRLTRLARQADVVHCTGWDPSFWGRIAAILARRPVIVADHATDRSSQISSKGAARSSWIARHNRLLDRFTFATVACATSQFDVLIGEGVDPEKIVHIPNGIPVDETLQAAAGGPTREELGLVQGVPVAMQVGLFREEKNQLGAVEAFARIREKVGDAQLVFVGDGPIRPRVERRVEELGGGEWTHFLGLRSDVPALLALSDLMLLPSIADAMPVVVLEAMALGVPIVATDVGDVRKLLSEGAGVCVAANDTPLFANACVELLTNPDQRAAMATAGRRAVRAFDASELTRRYAALFEAAATQGTMASALSGSSAEDIA
jgi:glycosyltransferase involved in cell wall biosynthesis